MIQGSRLIMSSPSWDSSKLLQPDQKKKGGFLRNFNVKGQIHDTTGLSIRNIAERERAKATPEQMNPEPVNGYLNSKIQTHFLSLRFPVFCR